MITNAEKASRHEPPKFSRKDGDVIEELSTKFGASSAQVLNYIQAVQEDTARKSLGLMPEQEKGKGQLLKKVDEALNRVDSVELISPNKKDEKNLAIEKQTVKDLIKTVFQQAARYAEMVHNLSAQAGFKSDEAEDQMATNRYQERVTTADRLRKAAHEALISDINIALRYINEHFARYSEEALENVVEKFGKRHEPFLEVKRIKFSHNVFLPDLMNIKVRGDIGKWAVLVTEELAKYRASLEQKH